MEKKFKSLNSFNAIMSGESEEDKTVSDNDIIYIATNKLVEITDQPFRQYTDDALKELAEDIKENGLLAPLVVQPISDDEYKILAGRNRYNACKLLELKEVACITKDVDDLKAEEILINSNLNQRHQLLPSEKAFAYKRKLELNRKKYNKSKILDLAEEVDESKTNINNYIRLTYLIGQFLNKVDNGTMPMRAGVNISFLSKENQNIVYEITRFISKKLTLEQSEQLKELNKEKELTKEDISNFFAKKEKSSNTKTKKVTFKYDELEEYIKDINNIEDLKEYIIKAINFYDNYIEEKE